jgi:hypothetical protein
MRPSLRKFVLTTHITFSVGWIGAVLAYLVLVVAAMTRPDAQTLRTAWMAMELIGWYLIVPLALASLLTGFGMSLGTPWGLFRHYWVLLSLVSTIVATVVLLQHMPTVSLFAGIAADTDHPDVGDLRAALRGELLHAGVGLLVLLFVEALNVFKPVGLTAYGRHQVAHDVFAPRVSEDAGWDRTADPAKAPRWARVVAIHAIALALLFVITHLAGGGLRHH